MDSDPLVLYSRAPRWLKRREFTTFAERLSQEVAGGQRFCCLVTGDAELQRLNHQFLGKDAPTDVLSFPSAAPGGLGDLAISVHRATDQASRFGHAPQEEMNVLLLHGVLHLLGYNHENDRGRMRRTETKWRQKLGLPAGLIERTGRA